MREEFRIVTGEQLGKMHGHWKEAGWRLDPARVPASLRHLIPFAETYGVSDDIARERLLANTPDAGRQLLSRLIDNADSDLDLWLAGPESTAGCPSNEYVAFSALRLFVLSI